MCQAVVPSDVQAAISWHAKRSPVQVMNEREKIMSRLEKQVSHCIPYSLCWDCCVRLGRLLTSGHLVNVKDGLHVPLRKRSGFLLPLTALCLSCWRASWAKSSTSVSNTFVMVGPWSTLHGTCFFVYLCTGAGLLSGDETHSLVDCRHSNDALLSSLRLELTLPIS